MSGNKLRILTRNLVDTATLYAVPAFVATLPETFLQRQTERGRYASTNAGVLAADLHLLWSSDQKVNCVGYTRTNLSTAATIRNQVFQGGSPSSRVYDSTALTAFSTSGLDTDIDVYTEADFRLLRSTLQYFPTLTNMQELVSTVTDTVLNTDGVLQLGRMWAGKYFEFSYHAPYGNLDLQVVDLSKGSRADDATHIVDKKGKFRRVVLRLDLIPDADLPSVLALSRYLGTDKECLLDLYPGLGGAKELYGRMACRQVDSPVFNPWQVGLHKNTMTFEET